MKTKTIKIKYHTDVTPLKKIEQGNWIDCRAAVDVVMKSGEFRLIPLGFSMELPKGYEAHLAPRSSTLKKFGVLQGNSVGVIDESFNGDEDQWFFPALAIKDTKFKKDQRICQFRIMEVQPSIKFKVVETLDNISRGSHGSTEYE